MEQQEQQEQQKQQAQPRNQDDMHPCQKEAFLRQCLCFWTLRLQEPTRQLNGTVHATSQRNGGLIICFFRSF
jgi:hypothetical protein